MGYITLSRDSFSRTELIRCVEEKDEHRQDGCAWCGSSRQRKSLFRYGTETNNGHSYWDVQAFCSKQCRDSYDPISKQP